MYWILKLKIVDVFCVNFIGRYDIFKLKVKVNYINNNVVIN